MGIEFRWNEWNLDHATRHGVSVAECERVVRIAKRPYPLARGDGKYLVVGRGQGDRLIRVVYVLDDDATVYVIHAMPLSDSDKRRHRRRTR